MRGPWLGAPYIGASADVILANLTALPFVPLNNLPRRLVHCEFGRSVLMTMVAGQILTKGGHLTTIDETAIMAEAAAFFAGKKQAMDMADQQVERYLPHYREMYRRAGACGLPLQRRLPNMACRGRVRQAQAPAPADCPCHPG